MRLDRSIQRRINLFLEIPYPAVQTTSPMAGAFSVHIAGNRHLRESRDQQFCWTGDPSVWIWPFPCLELFRKVRKVELRGEAFNILNKANFMNPTATLSSSSFGRILTAGDPRILQLALKLFF